MKAEAFGARQLLAPEHGGSNVKGGGQQPSVPTDGADDAVLAAMEAPKPGEPKVPGTPDPGVAGTRSNPVGEDEEPEPSTDKPVTPPRIEGSGAGS